MLSLVAVLITTAVIAQQGPGRRGGGPGGPGGPGGAFNNMAFGTVSNIDLATGVMTVQGRGMGGGPGRERTVSMHQDTKVLQQEEATVADLQVGEKITIAGVPTQIQASRLAIGENPMPGMGRGGMPRGPAGGGAPQVFGSAAGEILSVDPLQVKVSEEITVDVTPAADATYVKTVDAPEGALAPQVNVLCQGTAQDDGSLLADSVFIMPAGGMGMGM